MRPHLFGLLFLLCSNLSISYAQNFDFETDMKVQLGYSWNPLEPYRRASLAQCFQADIPSDSPVAEVTFSESFVETFQELERKSNVTVRAKGASSFGLARVSASAEYSRYKEVFSSDTSLVYAVSGVRRYNAKHIVGADLTSFGTTKLNEANEKTNPQIFYRACGKALIDSEVRETQISLIYIFKTSSSRSRERVRAAISAAIKSPTGGGGGSVDFISEARKVDSSVTYNTEVYQNGVRDSIPAVDLVVANAPGDIKEVRKAFRTAIANMRWENSPVVRFSAVNISDHFDIPRDTDADYVDAAYRSLDVLKSYADRVVQRYVQLEMLQQDVSARKVVYRPGKEVELISEKSDLLDTIELLINSAKKCFANARAVCRVDEPQIDNRLLHFVVVDFGNFLTWNAHVSGNHYDSHTERIKATVRYWPSYVVKNRRLIREIRFFRNGGLEKVLSGGSLDDRLSDSVLNLRDTWYREYRRSTYCWRGRWGEDCNPWAADIRRHKNETKDQDRGAQYEWIIVDIEGNEYRASHINAHQKGY